jgi:hypothetical protein
MKSARPAFVLCLLDASSITDPGPIIPVRARLTAIILFYLVEIKGYDIILFEKSTEMARYQI